ncbi:MAG: gamma carbonic anhydrase family protein [Bacillota bacterium]
MLYKFKAKSPKLKKDVFTAPGSKIIGDVELGEKSSIWYNTTIRADGFPIKIGSYTNIQDNSVVHIDEGLGTEIGSHVTVGHNAVIHACTVGDNCLIGMGATILSGAKIGKNSIIGAGALIPENKEIPEGSLVVGLPGKFIRKLSDEEIEGIYKHAEEYAGFAAEHMHIEAVDSDN